MAQISILASVAKIIAELGGKLVTEKVEEALVSKEVEKRASAVQKCVELLEQEEKNLKKVDRADVVSYDKDRKPISQTYSKKQLDEIEKINKRINKLTTAINKALDKGDFADVYNLQNGKLEDDTKQDKPGDAPVED